MTCLSKIYRAPARRRAIAHAVPLNLAGGPGLAGVRRGAVRPVAINPGLRATKASASALADAGPKAADVLITTFRC
jgi:hypothetical protein